MSRPLTFDHRERTIANILERWHELATPILGNPGDSRDTRVLRDDHDHGCGWAERGATCTCWVASVAELKRCLIVMRKLRKQKALTYIDRSSGHEQSEDIGVIYQQVVWWYVDVECRNRSTYVTKVVRHPIKGWQTIKVESGRRTLELHRHPGARQDKAEAGVRFLAALFRGTPCLPGDIAKLARAAA